MQSPPLTCVLHFSFLLEHRERDETMTRTRVPSNCEISQQKEDCKYFEDHPSSVLKVNPAIRFKLS